MKSDWHLFAWGPPSWLSFAGLVVWKSAKICETFRKSTSLHFQFKHFSSLMWLGWEFIQFSCKSFGKVRRWKKTNLICAQILGRLLRRLKSENDDHMMRTMVKFAFSLNSKTISFAKVDTVHLQTSCMKAGTLYMSRWGWYTAKGNISAKSKSKAQGFSHWRVPIYAWMCSIVCMAL